jgi:DNA adenine methylase
VNAPFPYFGGKRTVAAEVWSRLGTPKQYIEPFCGSAAVLLAARQPASLEVIGDVNGFIANFWRAVVHDPQAVARWADYPVSHLDLGARHVWLMGERERIATELQDAHWPGDAKVAGWWLWGQCCWIGSGWCEWHGQIPHVSDAGMGVQATGQIPHVSDAGKGVQATGQIPHVSNAGMGVQATGQIPHVSDAGMGVQATGQIPHVSDAGMGYWTTGGAAADVMLRRIARRMERVRIVHGSWDRCLNHHYGGDDTAVFLDPPYDGFEGLYRTGAVFAEVAEWARAHSHLRIALCGHRGDNAMPGWDAYEWDRQRLRTAQTKRPAANASGSPRPASLLRVKCRCSPRRPHERTDAVRFRDEAGGVMAYDDRRAAYAEKLKDPRWQKMRLKIMERDCFECQRCCDSTSTLNVHHLIYGKGEPWEVPESWLLTLCESCHEDETARRRDSEWGLIRSLRALGCLADDFDRLTHGFEKFLRDNPRRNIRDYESTAIGWFLSDASRHAILCEYYLDDVRERAAKKANPVSVIMDDQGL